LGVLINHKDTEDHKAESEDAEGKVPLQFERGTRTLRVIQRVERPRNFGKLNQCWTKHGRSQRKLCQT